MRQGKENRGGARVGAGRKPGPQPHLRSENPRHARVSVSVTNREWVKLLARSDHTGTPVATLLYELAKKGGL